MDSLEGKRTESEARKASAERAAGTRTAAAWIGLKRFLAGEVVRERRLAEREQAASRDQPDRPDQPD